MSIPSKQSKQLSTSLQTIKNPISLNEKYLSQLSPEVIIPGYNRDTVTNGIVHISVGGFHRSHQALYLDDYLEEYPDSGWGICGVGLLEYDRKMRDALRQQECFYTLVERSNQGDLPRVIGAITKYLFAPEEGQLVIDALADPQCRIVTLTITEGGYYVIDGSGEFDVNHPTIQHDLQHPDEPIGIYGFLTAALERRRRQNLTPFTVLSCDNIQGNGDVVGKMLTAFACLQNPDLGQWIAERGAFPNSMVDRITPATTLIDMQMIADKFGIQDACPVVAEPFRQWVIEDHFCGGRPDWEKVGVQMTDNVYPYEMMKLRLLNASHLLIGFLGSLLGYTYVHEAIANRLIRQAVQGLMAEVTPTLQPLSGVNLNRYKQTLIERFANPQICDRLSRLCFNNSASLPKYVLGSLRDKLNQDGSIAYMSLTIAAWFRYLNGKSDRQHSLPIKDPMADILTQRARLVALDGNPRHLLSLAEIFGDLAQSSRLVKAVTKYLSEFDRVGTRDTLAKLLQESD